MNDLASPDNIEKAAVLLMSLDADDASKVLKYLGPKEVQKLGMVMASLKNVHKDKVSTVIDEFFKNAEAQTSIGLSSDDYIRSVLVGALGEDKASGIVDKILLNANAKGLSTLKWMDPRSIADVIHNEHPQIQAIVLSHLEPDQAANVLMNFDERVRLDLIMRISTQEPVQPKALEELNQILEDRLMIAAAAQPRTIGGIKQAADIMNHFESTIEKDMVDAIKEKDEDLAGEIQELMFVFENLTEVDDRGIQSLLREISTETLILALKGADNELKEKIFSNMSKRAAELLKDDLESKGPVKVSDVELAQKEIIGIAKRMADNGELSLGGKGGEEMI